MKDKILDWLTNHNIVEEALCKLSMLEKTAAARWRALDSKHKHDTIFSFVVLLVCVYGLTAADSVFLTVGYIAGTLIMVCSLIDRFVKHLPAERYEKLFDIAFAIMCICFVIYFALHLLYIVAIAIAIFLIYSLTKGRK